MPETKLIRLEDGLYSLDQGGVRAFLILGTQRALLVDCGVFPDELPPRIAEATDLPVTVALTHTDGDHTRNIEQFDHVLLHPADEPILLRDHPAMAGKTAPLAEGDKIDLGGKVLEIFHIPGHTPGSIALLDRAAGYLIPGDTVGHEPVYLFGPTRDLSLYMQTLERLRTLDGFDRLYPSHGECPVGRSAIDTLLAIGRGIQDGSLTGIRPEAERLQNAGVLVYTLDGCGILHP